MGEYNPKNADAFDHTQVGLPTPTTPSDTNVPTEVITPIMSADFTQTQLPSYKPTSKPSSEDYLPPTTVVFSQPSIPPPPPEKLPIDPAPFGAVLKKGDFQSPNYRKGQRGWRVRSDGSAEFNEGVSASSLDIPDTTSTASMHIDTSGNTWWGANATVGYAGASAYVLNDGTAVFSNITITGTASGVQVPISKEYTAGEAITAGNAVSAGYYIAGGEPTFDAKSDTTVTTSGSVGTVSFTVANQTNRILIAVINNYVNSTNVTNIQYAGVSMTSITNDTTNDFYVYYLMAPTTGTNNFTFSGAAADANYKVTLYSFYNVNQTALVAADYNTSSVSGTSVSVPVTPAVDGAIVLGVIHGQSAITAGSGWQNENTSSATGQAGDTGLVVPAATITVAGSLSPSSRIDGASIVLRPIATLVYGVVKSKATAGVYSNFRANSFIGFAAENISAGSTGTIYISGVVSNQSGIVLGSQYYLSDTAGAIQTTAGTITRKVAIGLDSTSVLITNIW